MVIAVPNGTGVGHPELEVSGTEVEVGGKELEVSGTKLGVRGIELEIKGTEVEIRGLELDTTAEQHTRVACWKREGF